jgi:hypothetical protein
MTQLEDQIVELLSRAARSEAGISVKVLPGGDIGRAATALRKVAKAMGLSALSVRRTSDPNELWIIRIIHVK